MECGSQDLICQFVAIIEESEALAGGIADLLGRLGANATGFAGALAQFMRDYGQTLVGLLGFSFGFWRWWRYREVILHKRLAEYIGAREARLQDARAGAVKAIQRPAPGQLQGTPSFVDWELRSVLRETRWDNSVTALSVERSADWQLGKAITRIKERIQIADSEVCALRHELFTALTVRGAIAASSAQREKAWIARNHFREALELPGHKRDLLVKELEAHQLLRTGDFAGAEAAYQAVFAMADAISGSCERHMVMARVRCHLAEIQSANAPFNAYQMITAPLVGGNFSPGALALLEACGQLDAWGTLFKADLHFLAASWAPPAFVVVIQNNRDSARAAYSAVLRDTLSGAWFFTPPTRRLRGRAKAGLARL